ncbi:MAG: hypothetical protein K8S13_08275 [Desulfobacula sp.]|uniref:hypothetical protein n=1 Tax=Desulfobacula sp. TaxID=2593537 RepID=UPI0025C36903|nr:hypothetical protein [Desulfobacula sp.]MCD4719843.1 hypothetical protein [Desulfobacula sp.]
MKLYKNINRKYTIVLFTALCFLLLIKPKFVVSEEILHFKINPINKVETNYGSPENTYIALYSAQLKKDLEWIFETHTTASVEEIKQSFKKANININQIVSYELKEKISYITLKKQFKDSVLLVVEHFYKDGEIAISPVTFLIEDGVWKKTNKFAADIEFQDNLAHFYRTIVDNLLDITYSGVRYNRRTRQFYSAVTITNTSDKELEGPVWLIIKKLQPEEASLANADGIHFGEPYMIMLGEEKKWPPGQALPAKTLYFSNPVKQRLNFDDQVFAVVPDEGS